MLLSSDRLSFDRFYLQIAEYRWVTTWVDCTSHLGVYIETFSGNKHKFILNGFNLAKLTGMFFTVPAVIPRDKPFKLNPVVQYSKQHGLFPSFVLNLKLILLGSNCQQIQRRNLPLPSPLLLLRFWEIKILRQIQSTGSCRSWIYRKLTQVSPPVHRTTGRLRLEGASGGL